MVRVVYADVLFGVNLAVNYLILLSTGRLVGRTVKWRNLLASSFLGAIYATSHLFFLNYTLFSLPARIVFGALMVHLAFPGAKGSGLVVLVASFYISSAVAAGTAYAFLAKGSDIILGNSVFTGKDSVIRWWMMAASLVAVTGIPVIAAAGGYRPGKKLPLFQVEVLMAGKKLSLTALMDTGNNLRDPFSGLPVLVVDWDFARCMVPKELQGFFRSSWELVPGALLESPLGKRVRLIPCRSVSGKKSVLLAFRPDGVIITGKDGQRFLKKAVVGVSRERLSPQGNFQALLHPDLLDFGQI